MPMDRINIYVRDEDFGVWLLIKDKTKDEVKALVSKCLAKAKEKK